MANEIPLTTANKVEIVESVVQMTLPTDEAVTAGMAVRISTTTGKFTKANGTGAAEARAWGVATRTVASGQPVTGQLPIGSFSADRISADLNERTVRLSGHARLRINQGGIR